MSRLADLRQRLRAPVRAGTRRRAAGEPTLSVVVPVHNVEPYLAECLTSVLGQRLADGETLEVVAVDDGSTDGSGAILAELAERDPRLRVLSQANAGLGAARNAGVELVRAPYLTFVDSDDVVPPGGYRSALQTLQESGSDFLCGALERWRGEQRHRMPLMAENHTIDRPGVTLAQMPLALADVFAVNKMFRTDFWRSAGLSFPTDVRYEDQPTLTEAFTRAERFDMLAETVYWWRQRDDGSSITQNRDTERDLADRLLTKRWSTTTVCERTAGEVQQLWFRRILPVDMWEYFRAVPGCSQSYWELLVAGVREFWHDGTVRFEHTEVPPRQREMGRLVAAGDRAGLEAWLEEIDRGRRPV